MADPNNPFTAMVRKAEAAKSVSPAPRGNPYPEGSEEWQWYQNQLAGAPAPPTNQFSAITGSKPRAPDPTPAYHGSFLPFSRDSSGHIYFDPFNAGPIGAMKQGATLPGRVMSGETPMPRTFDPSVMTRAQTSPIMGEILNMATSAPGMPLKNPAVRSGDYGIPGAKRNIDLGMATPTEEALLEKGGGQRESYKNLNFGVSPGYVGGPLSTQMEQKLLDMGIGEENSPLLYAFIRGLRKNVPKSDDPSATLGLGPKNLVGIRDVLTGLYGNAGEHQKGVNEVHKILDNFITNTPAEAVTGPASAIVAPYAGQLFREGNANYAAGKRSGVLGDIQTGADLSAASANSGLNFDNSIRGRVARAIIQAKKLKGFNDPEQELLAGVPEGSAVTNVQRWLGNFMGGGGGLGAHIAGGVGYGIGNYFGGPSLGWWTGAAVPLAGAGFKKLAGQSTNEALENVKTVTRQRSPLFEQNLVGADVVPSPDTMSSAIFPTLEDRLARNVARGVATIGSGESGVPLETPPQDRLYVSPNQEQQ